MWCGLGSGWHLRLTLFSGPGTADDISRKHLGLLPAGPAGLGGGTAPGCAGGQASTARGLAEVGCPRGHQSLRGPRGGGPATSRLPCVAHL